MAKLHFSLVSPSIGDSGALEPDLIPSPHRPHGTQQPRHFCKWDNPSPLLRLRSVLLRRQNGRTRLCLRNASVLFSAEANNLAFTISMLHGRSGCHLTAPLWQQEPPRASFPLKDQIAHRRCLFNAADFFPLDSSIPNREPERGLVCFLCRHLLQFSSPSWNKMKLLDHQKFSVRGEFSGVRFPEKLVDYVFRPTASGQAQIFRRSFAYPDLVRTPTSSDQRINSETGTARQGFYCFCWRKFIAEAPVERSFCPECRPKTARFFEQSQIGISDFLGFLFGSVWQVAFGSVFAPLSSLFIAIRTVVA